MSNHRFDPLIFEYTQNSTEEAAVMQAFIDDYLKRGTKEAIQKLNESGAPEPTRNKAHEFVNEAYLVHEKINHDKVLDLSKNMTKGELQIYSEFFKTIRREKNWDVAYNKAMKLIDQNPQLKYDEGFLDKFNKLSNKFKPQKKKGLYDFNITPEEGAIIKITLGHRKEYMTKIPDLIGKMLIHNAMHKCMEPFLASLKESEDLALINKIELGKCELGHEVDCLYSNKKTSLQSRLSLNEVLESRNKFEKEYHKYKELCSTVNVLTEAGLKNPYDGKQVVQRATELLDKKVSTPLDMINEYRKFIYKVQSIKTFRYKIDKSSLDMSKVRDALKELMVHVDSVKDEKSMDLLKRYFQKEDPQYFDTTNPLAKKVYKDIIPEDFTRKNMTALLGDAYSLYMNFNRKEHLKDLRQEVNFIAKGKSSLISECAIHENDKRKMKHATLRAATIELTNAVESMKFEQRERSQKDVKQAKKSASIKDDVMDMIKERNLKVDISAAFKEPDQPHKPGLGPTIHQN